MTAFTESVVEQPALAWRESLGWRIMHGLEIAPGEPGAERADYAALRDTLLPKLISGELRVKGKPRPEKNPPTNLANSRRPN